MIDILLSLVEELAGGRTERIVGLVAMLCVLALGMAKHKKSLPRYLFLACAGMAACGVLALAGILAARDVGTGGNKGLFAQLPVTVLCRRRLVFAGAAAAAGLALFAARRYTHIRKELRTAVQYTKREEFSFNLIEAWRHLDELPPSMLTGAQHKQYKRYRLYLRMLMGNFSGIEGELEEMEKDAGNQAYYHFLKFIQMNATGHMKAATEHIRKAEEACNADTEPLIYVQILTNRGVGYVGIGQYKDAQDCFSRAFAYAGKKKIRQKEVWEILYYNYIFNETRLNPDISREEWEQLLEGLTNYIDVENPIDFFALSNIQMDLLRQTGASAQELEEHVFVAMEYLLQADIPQENRCVLETQIARMIWSAAMNPLNILLLMGRDLEKFRELPMPARYHCFKQMDIFFGDLHGPAVEHYDKLRQNAHWYMVNQAEMDLENYRKGLPDEAVYERCFCFDEIAGIQKKRDDRYDWKKFHEQLENAMTLYHENGMELDVHRCRLAIMDEACWVSNMDKHYKIAYLEEMQEQLAKIEAFLPSLERHPMLVEIYLRLAFYCFQMDDYGKCMIYYEKFRDAAQLFALEHFAPWLHRYYTAVCFVVRALYFKDAVVRILASQELRAQPPLVQQWFDGFAQGDGYAASVALGRFMGAASHIPLKLRVWKGERPDTPDFHAWLVMEPIGMEIDLTYQTFSMDAHAERIFYVTGHHPMETGESYFIKDRHMSAQLPFQSVICQNADLAQLEPEQVDALERVLRLIEGCVDKKCPSLAELAFMYKTTMLPRMGS